MNPFEQFLALVAALKPAAGTTPEDGERVTESVRMAVGDHGIRRLTDPLEYPVPALDHALGLTCAVVEEVAFVRVRDHRQLVHNIFGSMRREFLDHVLFWNARDLERKLGEFQTYYNGARCHASLKGHTPATLVGGHAKTLADLSHVRWVSYCKDLVPLPVAA